MLKNVHIDHNRYINTFDNEPMGIADSGIYYILDDILYYKEDGRDPISLDYVNYIDGNKSKINESIINYTQIDEFVGRDLICYDDRIYLEYCTSKYDGSMYYSLASVNLKGKDLKTHIVFDFIPQRLVIDQGNVYVLYYDSENIPYINIYNNHFKLKENKKIDPNLNELQFYILDGELVIPDHEYTYESNNIYSKYRVENIQSEQDRKVISTITLNGQTITFENKFILFINDCYFYTSSCTYPQTYERYTLNGELDSSIVIEECIDSKGEFNHLLITDFSYIVKLKNDDIAYGHSNHHLFEVDFSKGTCHYVEE